MATILRLLLLPILLSHTVSTYRYSGSRREKCHQITKKTLPFCVNMKGGYAGEIMLPNDHSAHSVKEVRAQLSLWSPLVPSNCNAHLQKFLCSVYAPVCFTSSAGQGGAHPLQDVAVQKDSIKPCRSLCDEVQKGCEPVMRKYGNLSWPAPLNCSQFPVDNSELCISGGIAMKTATCPAKLNFDEARRKYCQGNSDKNFVIQARILKWRGQERSKKLTIKFRDVTVIKGRGIPTNKPLRARLALSFKDECPLITKKAKKSSGKSSRKEKYLLIIGQMKGKHIIAINYMVRFSGGRKKTKSLRKMRC